MSFSPLLQGFVRASMVLGVFLLVGVTIAGCREMIATPPAEPERDPEVANRSLLILGVDGEPLVDALIRVSDWGLQPSWQGEDWSGRTNLNGSVRPEVPPGEYWVKVTPEGAPDNSDEPVWVEPRIWVGNATITVDPRPRVRHGRIQVPPEFPPGDFMIQLLAEVEYEAREISFTVNTGVREDGTFETVWVEGATYSIALGSRSRWSTPRANLLLDSDSFPDHPDSLVITWEPGYFDIELLLGGEPCPPAYVTATVSSDLANFEAELVRTVTGSRFSMPSEPGPMTLRISPDGALPCISREFQIDLEPGSVITVELGEHEVWFQAVTDEGIPLGSIELELEEAVSGRRSTFRSGQNERLFLPGGNYLFKAFENSSASFPPVSSVASIQADTTITFVFSSGESPD